MPEKITLQIQNTPSGRLLARALEIMGATGCTMGEAMDRARTESTEGSTMHDQMFTTDHERSLTREEGIAFLLKNGPHLATPCSRYGRNAEACAPVAWRVAEVVADETGEAVTEDGLDYAMGLVVNDSDDVERLLHEHGTPEDLELLPEVEEDASEEPCTDHGFDVCPDCGNVGVKIEANGGYVPCTRFLTCWTDMPNVV